MTTRRALALSLLASAAFTLTACHGVHAPSRGVYRDAAPRAHEPERSRDRDGYRRDIRSGTLTAGHFDDGDDARRFSDWAQGVATLGEAHGFVDGFQEPAIQITLVNEHGDPVHNAAVRATGHGQRRSAYARSGTDGRVVLLPGFDGLDDGSIDLTINTPGVSTIRDRIFAHPGEHLTYTVHSAKSELPDRLDLALIIDTTGSMSDELEYLKVEFRAIVERIEKRFPHVDQRWALVVYRDEGDSYVVRGYDFTSSLGRMVDRIGDQRANGGGDYPEAVHQAFEEGVDLDWRDNSAKIAFVIADAPPHADRAEDAMRHAADMRARGISVYPVASSGVRAEAEHFFRAAALMTGGGYSFLTDDSGVGNPHSEPHEAPGYSVQQLDDLIVQLVESELTGASREPRRRDIVREVPGDNPQQQDRPAVPDTAQVRAWRERRDNLIALLGTTDLSSETVSAIRDEIASLDRSIAGVNH